MTASITCARCKTENPVQSAGLGQVRCRFCGTSISIPNDLFCSDCGVGLTVEGRVKSGDGLYRCRDCVGVLDGYLTPALRKIV